MGLLSGIQRLGDTSGRGNPARNWARAIALILGIAVVTQTPAFANNEILLLSRDLYRDRQHQEGNQISFCYYPDGMMADFELDLAQEIGAVLLTDIRMVPLPPSNMPAPPYDHRIPLLPERLYILLMERCAAFIGYALSGNQPDWLLVTRPYMEASMVLVTRDPDIRRLQDLALDWPIGTRAQSVADNRLINFLQARPEEQRWRRFPYFSNAQVLDYLEEGTIGLGLVWEPALNFLTDGDPEGAGYHVLSEMPFASPPIQIGIAIREDDAYLNALFGDAIDMLTADGTVERLLQEHGLLPPDGDFLEVPADG